MAKLFLDGCWTWIHPSPPDPRWLLLKTAQMQAGIYNSIWSTFVGIPGQLEFRKIGWCPNNIRDWSKKNTISNLQLWVFGAGSWFMFWRFQFYIKYFYYFPSFPGMIFWGLIQLQFFLGGMGGSTTNWDYFWISGFQKVFDRPDIARYLQLSELPSLDTPVLLCPLGRNIRHFHDFAYVCVLYLDDHPT